jgi:hypothetical protein
MDFLPEIREFIFQSALNDLNIVRWTLLERQLNGDRAAEYLDALIAYRNSEWEYELASRVYRTFLKTGSTDWEEEERLYEKVRKCRCDSDRTHQVLQDMLLESEDYETQPEELPYYS